jgi:hypothetical protein
MKNKLIKFIVAGAVPLMLAATSYSSIAAGDFYGEPAQPSASSRTVTISKDTQYVNVTGGEIIKFVTPTKTFTWNFNTFTRPGSAIDINRIAPADALDHEVKVYIAADPSWAG